MITEEECIKIGGHCYETENRVIATYPPIYHRKCKHCGKRQESVQDPIMWKDDE